MKLRKDNQAMNEPDYNYKINLQTGELAPGMQHNPLLASVNTQGSLKNQPNKSSGINITKKEAVANLKASMNFVSNNI